MKLKEFYKESPTKIKARQRIIDVGIKLFSENGMDIVSMVDIAKDCEMTTRNLYRYYPSKDFLVMDTAFSILSKNSLSKGLKAKNLSGIDQLETFLNQIYNAEKKGVYGLKFIRFVMYFDLYVSKLSEDNLALQRYIALYRDHIDDQVYVHLKDIIKHGIADKTIHIAENDVEFYTVFLLQSLLSVTMRTMIKESENRMINGKLVEKQIEMMVSYLKTNRL